MSATMTKQIPRDAQVIQAILKDMGIAEYEPRVVNQLLEFVYRYVTTVLDDAKAYANHAKKKAIDLEDVKLAVAMQMEQSFTTPPPREILMEVARSKNSVPLPPAKPHCGIRLPPDRYCLSACNYKLKATKKPTAKSMMASSAAPRLGGALAATKAAAVVRPSSPQVRAQAPRPIIKMNAGAAATKIQITVPPPAAAASAAAAAAAAQPTAVIKQEVEEPRGIKRDREDDDYDAP